MFIKHILQLNLPNDHLALTIIPWRDHKLFPFKSTPLSDHLLATFWPRPAFCCNKLTGFFLRFCQKNLLWQKRKKKKKKKKKKADLPTLTFLGMLQETNIFFLRPYIICHAFWVLSYVTSSYKLLHSFTSETELRTPNNRLTCSQCLVEYPKVEYSGRIE